MRCAPVCWDLRPAFRIPSWRGVIAVQALVLPVLPLHKPGRSERREVEAGHVIKLPQFAEEAAGALVEDPPFVRALHVLTRPVLDGVVAEIHDAIELPQLRPQMGEAVRRVGGVGMQQAAVPELLIDLLDRETVWLDSESLDHWPVFGV